MTTAPPPKQIRFVHNQGQPPSKRRRINAACLTCRKRKTRCAGERPVCSTCTKNGHECLGYNEAPDKKQGDGANDRPRSAHDGQAEGYLDDVEEEGPGDTAPNEVADMKPPQTNSTGEGTAGGTSASKMLSPPRPPPSHKTTSPALHFDRRSRSQELVPQLPPSGRRRTSDNDSRDRIVRPPPPAFPRSSASEEGRSLGSHSPTLQFKDRLESHRVPYFRYFGPTAIVPGYKQMVVSVRERRRSNGGSGSATSPSSTGVGQIRSIASAASQAGSEAVIEELPIYDVNDQAPVPPLILHLVKVFFAHLGCNYPFLKEERFTRMVQEKRVEPILVDAVCALAARFSDSPHIVQDGKLAKSEYGQQYAQRAKVATVDTFPAPSVGAVQALLMMAYEGFGANQDSALWMYLGLAIRMAVDLGLQKVVGVKYQGEKDPWYVRHWARGSSEAGQSEHAVDDDGISREQELEVEQERMDTFWTVFVLDRVISSGTGRPVTFRDDDFEFDLPRPAVDPTTGWPNPFPTFVRIIHLYGRASDVLNNIHDAKDLTRDKWTKLSQMENELTRLYQKQDPRLHFNVGNFKAYLSTGQSTTFILMHFWFHALIIILHQPTLLSTFGSMSRAHQLLPNSRELSMSSAKTIADILSFAELIGPTSFIGNPFTSQPMYIAACAFLMESASMASQPASREHTPPEGSNRADKAGRNSSADGGGKFSSKHSLLTSAANQNYSRCYNSLQQLNAYWGGVKYILTALDQKSKGIWDCETYTNEEYESTKTPSMRRASLTNFPPFEHPNPTSPNMPPFAWSLTGATNSPNSSLTLMYQNMQSGTSQPSQMVAGQQRNRNSVSSPGNMVYDPIRQSQPEAQAAMYAAAFPQHSSNTNRQPLHGRSQRSQGPPAVRQTSRVIRPPMVLDNNSESPPLHRNPPGAHSLTMPPPQHPGPMASPVFPSAQQSGYDAFSATTPNAAMAGETPGSGQASHAMPVGMGQTGAGMFDPTFGTGGYSYMDQSMGPIGDVVTYENPIDLGSLGLTNDMMPQWLEYLPTDVLGMFEGGNNMDDNGGNGGGGS